MPFRGHDGIDGIDRTNAAAFAEKTGLALASVTTNGVAVAVADNACSIVSNTTVAISFTAASGYQIVSGNPVVLTVTADKTLAADEYPVVEEEGGQGGGGDPVVPVAEGWTAVAMGPTSASIRTDGTLKYAYATGNYTANGVVFTASSGIINNADCVVWENTGGAQLFGSSAPSETESGGYKNLLENGWWANGKGRKIQLNNLESGKSYLVQIIGFRKTYTTQTATAPDGKQVMKFDGENWEYGGSLVGIFTASGTTEEFTITYAGQSCINGIQVRELAVEGGSESAAGNEIKEWPADPDAAITDATRPSDLGIVTGAFAETGTSPDELRKLVRWARANDVTFAGADVNAMSFDSNGNPETLHAAAYLLNCAVDDVDESLEAFKFPAIVPGTVPSIEGDFNGRVTVSGAEDLSGPWQAATTQHRFFKATLTR